MGGVRAIADGAEAIQSRNAKRRREISVGASTGRGLAQGKPELPGEGNGASEEHGALLAFEGRAIKTAVDFKLGAAMDGFQTMQAFLEGAHISGTPGTQVEFCLGEFRDNVHA